MIKPKNIQSFVLVDSLNVQFECSVIVESQTISVLGSVFDITY